jgi:uncharacterized membrane protein
MPLSAAYAPAPWPRAAPAPGIWRFATESDAEGGTRRVEWLLKRNCSMSPAQLFGVYLSLAAVSLAIALGFTWHGASPVLAFAGIELLLVGVALLVYARHIADHERITLAGATLSVAHQRGAETDRCQFRAAWVRVEPLSSDRSLIELTGDGQTAHVGRYLRPDLRQPLAQELRLALRSQQRLAPDSSFLQEPEAK